MSNRFVVSSRRCLRQIKRSFYIREDSRPVAGIVREGLSRRAKETYHQRVFIRLLAPLELLEELEALILCPSSISYTTTVS